MKKVEAGLVLLMATIPSSCSNADRNACYGISDREALDNVLRDYESEPPAVRIPKEQISQERLVGIGRTNYPKGSDNLIQLWFRQDDGTMIVASYFEDCELKVSKGTAVGMRNAAYPVKPPKF